MADVDEGIGAAEKPPASSLARHRVGKVKTAGQDCDFHGCLLQFWELTALFS